VIENYALLCQRLLLLSSAFAAKDAPMGIGVAASKIQRNLKIFQSGYGQGKNEQAMQILCGDRS
jgi:hypothetical protein